MISRDQRTVVVRARMRAARRPGLVGGAAQVAAGRERQKRLDRGARQGDHVFAGETALDRRSGSGGAGEFRQPGEVGFVEHEAPVVLVVQDILAEQRVQRREPLGDRRHARLLLRTEQRPGPHEAQMIAFEQTALVRRQSERIAIPVQRIDAGEQRLHRA